MRLPAFTSILAALALLAGASVAHAQSEDAPAILRGLASAPAIPGADREHSGERAIGDVLAENAWADRRTARLSSNYDADIQGRRVSLPAGTPFIARHTVFIPMAGAPPAPEPARGTVTWCAADPALQWAPCFFWDAEGGVHGHIFMMGGPPSERAWLGQSTPAPMPELAEQDVGLPPRTQRLVLERADAEGYVLQLVTQEVGVTYTRSYPRRAWGEWRHVFLARDQRMRAAPIVDESGAVRGATIEFTREPPTP